MSNAIKLSELQTSFLDSLVQKKLPVAVYLKNGIKLKGIIVGFDDTCLIINHPAIQIVQLSAVSTVATIMTFESFEN